MRLLPASHAYGFDHLEMLFATASLRRSSQDDLREAGADEVLPDLAQRPGLLASVHVTLRP